MVEFKRLTNEICTVKGAALFRGNCLLYCSCFLLQIWSCCGPHILQKHCVVSPPHEDVNLCPSLKLAPMQTILRLKR